MAFLKGLELQGFKSFAGKTLLDFPSRVVAIVGPNGSGKSNVIDALRWVLGEREAKQLRGGTLDNLIFAGTPKKAAVSLARVGLLFDNTDGTFPVGSNEVFLERRVDRSGTSQFYINGDEIRMRDLVPMLARAKLGARGLTMIGQGQSDIFVQSSPEERRLMIEEVLGLKEFRIKKAQAERRLAASAINMDKVRAMLEELLPHLRLLRRQKHRWDRRSEIENELRDHENAFFSFRYHAFRHELDSLSRPSEHLAAKKAALEAEVKDLEDRIRATGETSGQASRAREIRERVSELFRKRTTLGTEIARIEMKIEIEKKESVGSDVPVAELRNFVNEFRNKIDDILSSSDLESVKEILLGWKKKVSGFFVEKAPRDTSDLEAERKKTTEEIQSVDREVKALRDEEESIARVQETANREFRAFVEKLEAKKNEIRKIERDAQEQSFARERVAIRIEELEKDWVNAGRSPEELKKLPHRDGASDEDVHGMERKILRLRGELAAIGEIDENLVKEADESEERYEFLTKELDDLEHAIADLKKLIAELDEKIGDDFKSAFKQINDEFNNYFRLMFGGGKAHMKIERKRTVPRNADPQSNAGEENLPPDASQEEEEKNEIGGVEIELNLPKKRITNLDMLSGGEKSLVSIAALFALIAVSPPPFLVLDEVDAPLDESNARRFADLVAEFSSKTQFIIVTHNRATMEAADVLYGVTMADDGVSKILSMKFEETNGTVRGN